MTTDAPDHATTSAQLRTAIEEATIEFSAAYKDEATPGRFHKAKVALEAAQLAYTEHLKRRVRGV